jgi:phosphomannomutase/phosphoglucomutase
MEHIFRAYDIRGKFPDELTPEVVRGIGYFLGKRIEGPVLVTYDVRPSSPILFEWLVEGLTGAGREVIFGGVVPTGTNYFGNFYPVEVEGREVKVGGGIQITGSHNPPAYNGFKITINRYPFYGEELKELGREVMANLNSHPVGKKEYKVTDLKGRYISHLVKEFSHLKGVEIDGVFDPGNGAVGVLLRELLERLGVKRWKIICEEPDGSFPCHHPDPSDPANLEQIIETMEEEGYRHGFAFDGDGDRLGFLEKWGEEIKVYSGDELLFLLASHLNSPKTIVDVKTSQAIIDKLKEKGEVLLSKTGHSNLKVLLYKTGAHLAGEVSGHLFFHDRYIGVDDGVYGALRVMELIAKGAKFRELLAQLPPIITSNEEKIGVEESRKFQIVEELKRRLKEKKEELGVVEIVEVDGVRVHFSDGWGLVRASNTTPTLTMRFEASTEERLKEIRNLFLSLLPV